MFKPGDILNTPENTSKIEILEQLMDWDGDLRYKVKILPEDKEITASERMIVNFRYKLVKEFTGSIEFEVNL